MGEKGGAYQLEQETMAEVMTGRVMVQGQLVMVRVVAFLRGLG